jgi:hypothetical protein
MNRSLREVEFRCDCRSRRLLALCGVNEEQQLYVYVKAYKQKQIITELIVVLVEGAKLKLKCPSCMRWQTLRAIGKKLESVRTTIPKEIQN